MNTKSFFRAWLEVLGLLLSFIVGFVLMVLLGCAITWLILTISIPGWIWAALFIVALSLAVTWVSRIRRRARRDRRYQ